MKTVHSHPAHAIFAILALLATCLLCAQCAKEPESKGGGVQAPDKAIKVSVFKDGRVDADGKTVTVEELSKMLSEAKAQGMSVWYYREAGAEAPHPNALQVIKAIVDHRLPVRLSSRPDFSDAVDEDGKSRPAKKS